MDRARVLGSLAALLVLNACGPLPRAPKCNEPPAPVAEDFAACGGINYHAGPGPIVPFAIKFKSELGPDFELTELCVLIDDYSALPKGKAEWSGNLFRGKHVIKVQAVYRAKDGSVGVTIRSATEIAALASDTLEIVAYAQGGPTTPIEKRPAVRWVKPKESKCE